MRYGANIVRNTYGGITNESSAAIVYVNCGIINDASLKLSAAWVAVSDSNPNDDISCTLTQLSWDNTGYPRFWFTHQKTDGGSGEFEYLYYVPDPTYPTG